MEIENIGELLYACNENRLLLYKGFGEKTQEKVKASIEFYFKNKGSFLYAEVEGYAEKLIEVLQQTFSSDNISFAGDYKRQSTIIKKLELIVTVSIKQLEDFFTSQHFSVEEKTALTISFKGPENILLEFICTDKNSFGSELFKASCSENFREAWRKKFGEPVTAQSEEDIFKSAGIHFIPAYLREKENIISKASTNDFSDIIQTKDIKGIIHNHSNWSDGINTIEEMADACIKNGWEYLVLSDHSKTAGYANGLKEDRIKAQHAQIVELNKRLYPFKIFKSIESDILNDGALDYDTAILSSFDLVIASIHSNLYMNEEKAMMRLMNAIQNPYTTILGHMTGRLLLSRNGYPIDHLAIIEACVANKVAIELNAHPRRLDIDWSWIDIAIDKGAMISIDPDAHHVDGFHDIKYGVLAAQKAGLTSAKNLSSFSLIEFEKYLHNRKQERLT